MLGTDCPCGVGECMKANKWGDPEAWNPVVTNKGEWGQHSN